MNRIEQVFQKLNRDNNKALIPYVSCGDPDLEFTEKLIPVLEEGGADIIELGVPYSDPVADGPTIQKASLRALEAGINLEKIFSLAERLSKKSRVPLVLMTYYNPIFVTGVDNFINRAHAAGIDGLIVPDLPPEEASYLKEAADNKGLSLTFLIAPTSTNERIQKAAGVSSGFVYCVSVTGVTGARQGLSKQLESFISRARQQTQLPLAVGFGISNSETARQAAAYADGVIVGSALINIIEESMAENNRSKALEEAFFFVKELKEAIP